MIFFKVSTAIIGFALATMYPSGLLWCDKIINVSYKVGALFLIHAPMHPHITMDPWIPIAAYIGTIHIRRLRNLCIFGYLILVCYFTVTFCGRQM